MFSLYLPPNDSTRGAFEFTSDVCCHGLFYSPGLASVEIVGTASNCHAAVDQQDEHQGCGSTLERDRQARGSPPALTSSYSTSGMASLGVGYSRAYGESGGCTSFKEPYIEGAESRWDLARQFFSNFDAHRVGNDLLQI